MNGDARVVEAFRGMQRLFVERLYRRLFAIQTRTLFVETGGEHKFNTAVLAVTQEALEEILRHVRQTAAKK